MKITILTVGKIKEKFYRDAIAEYTKRLSRYASVEVIEVADESTKENASDAEIAQVLQKESERLLSKIKDSAYCVALAILGKKMDSVAFANAIQNVTLHGKSEIVFVIGGSLGLHNSVLKRADAQISFSDMTFPHQLMRVILLEQIYRAYRILNNEPYHK